MFAHGFDPTAELDVLEKDLPHWCQAGTVVFTTFRLFDSIPKSVLLDWNRQKREWLEWKGFGQLYAEGFTPASLPETARREFQNRFYRQREEFLDAGAGACLLARRESQEILSQSLLYFDGERYQMGDFVIMPNHVHLLAVFSNLETMLTQYDSWLHYTAWRINKAIGRKGKLWQSEPFDHLVRSLEQYEYLRKYIRENPHKAGLREGDFLYRRRPV